MTVIFCELVLLLQNKALKAKEGGVTKAKKSAEGHTAKGKAFYKAGLQKYAQAGSPRPSWSSGWTL